MTTRVSYELNALRDGVQSHFAKVRAALYMREKLLLRQLDVIAQQNFQQQREPPMSIKFLINEQEEADLYASIRSFGRFQLGDTNLALQNVYLRHEDYIKPNKDHEVMNKCLTHQEMQSEIAVKEKEEEEEQEQELISLTQNKLLMENTCRQISESIINLTLTEAKKLLNQTQNKLMANFVPTLDLENEENITSSQVDAISSLLQDQTQTQTSTNSKQRCKHKIVINNCNGTINLRNIASLIINCTPEDAVNAELPLQVADNNTTATTDDGSNHLAASTMSSSSNKCHCKISKNSSNGINKTQYQHHSINSSSLCSNRNKNKHLKLNPPPTQIEESATAATCEFYNNLLLQIKNSLVTTKSSNYENSETHYMQQKSHKHNEKAEQQQDYINENDCVEEEEENDEEEEEELSRDVTSVSDVNDNEASCTQSQQAEESSSTNNRRLVLRNFENLKIILEANSDEETSHPVQIEQWLAEIISESDLEPIANTDFLEHSKIDSS